MKRVWLFVPIFTGIVVLPATLSIVTPGDVVLTLWHGHPEGLTEQGVTSASLVVCRVATSISLVVLVTLTTPWTRLLAALRSLGVPRMFVLIIGMAYRYIFLLLASVQEMHDAMIARGYRGDAKVLSIFALKSRDYAFAAGLVLAAAVIYEGDRRLGR